MDSLTLAAWGRTWIERMRALVPRGILRAPTVDVYERVVRLHLEVLAEMPLAEMRRPVLIAWANGQIAAGASRKSLVLRVAVLKVCLRDAMSEGLIQTNPAERLISSLRLPRPRQVVRWFADEGAAARFLAAAEDGPEWPGLALMAYTGLRIGEATGLRWEDVDLESRRLVVRRQVTPKGQISEPKTAAGARLVDLPAVLSEVLRHHRTRQKEEALRAGRFGPSPWVLGIPAAHNAAGRSRLRKAMRRVLATAGLPHLTPHGLRHSWLSFRALLGQDARLIQAQAGHSDPEMTRHYTHLERSDSRAVDEVAEAIRPRQKNLFGRGKIPLDTGKAQE